MTADYATMKFSTTFCRNNAMSTRPDDILILEQAFSLLVIGMGITFVFMYALVWVMRGIAKVIPRFNHLLPDPEVKK